MQIRALIIDLTEKAHHVEELWEGVVSQYIGGRGVGAWLLSKYCPEGADPLSPENPLIFVVGPAQGTSTPYSSRTVLVTKSPLTGIYLYSVAGGTLGHNVRKAGYSAIVILGKAQAPTYLTIVDDKVEYKPADFIWGKPTIESQSEMIAREDLPRASAAVIGPAGEAGVKMACVVTEGWKCRTFGRGGAGAVMGSKNLKGIIVYGTKEVQAANPEMLKTARQNITQQLKSHRGWVETWKKYGTGSGLTVLSELGILLTRNWQTGQFEGASRIAPPEIEQEWPRKNTVCGPYCPSPCAHVARITRGRYAGVQTEGPEYETLYALGSNCGVDQFDAIVAAERICDDYGIDTMSCGVAVGFAMECYERGLLTQRDCDGLELKFGNAEAMVELVRKIARGEGIGKLLGQGVRAASKEIPGSAGFAMHVKGLELGGYECRGAWGQALQFALSTRGGCHHALGLPARTEIFNGTGTQLEGKGELLKKLAVDRVIFDCAVMCTFPRAILSDEIMPEVLSGLTGLQLDQDKLQEIGLRIISLERQFNVREGITKEDDTLPERLLKEPLPSGPNRGKVVPLKELLLQGYKALGWDF